MGSGPGERGSCCPTASSSSPVPSGSGLTELPMHARQRTHYPLLPRNAATGEETPEMEKLYHGFGAFTIAAKNMIYEILALSILFYILMKKEKMVNFFTF
jgi:hypothetical protein